MKRFIMFVTYFLALGSLIYMLFIVPEPTNKHLLMAIFDAVVIITISIQKEEQ
jgi:hypothetical protein